MKETVAENGLWWSCPMCAKKNFTSDYEGLFCCETCLSYLYLNEIIESYREANSANTGLQEDRICMAVRWKCDCGEHNIVVPRVVCSEIIIEDEVETLSNFLEAPAYGLCESCFREYDLVISG